MLLSPDSFAPLSLLLFEFAPSFDDEDDEDEDEFPSGGDDGGFLSDEEGGFDEEANLNERK
jgi:hypothetical protein